MASTETKYNEEVKIQAASPRQAYKTVELVDMIGTDKEGNQKIYKKLEMCLRFEITEITCIDTQNQRYGIKGAVRRIWKATELDLQNYRSNPDNYSPQFKPKFHFVNSVETFNLEYGRFRIKKNKYNQQIVRFNMIFTEEFEIENFPFDVQDLSVVLRESHDPEQLTHNKPPNELFNSYIMFDKTWFSITDWTIVNVDMSIIEEEFYARYRGQSYETIIFRVQVKRKWKGVIYRLILWLLFLGNCTLNIFVITFVFVYVMTSISMTVYNYMYI